MNQSTRAACSPWYIVFVKNTTWIFGGERAKVREENNDAAIITDCTPFWQEASRVKKHETERESSFAASKRRPTKFRGFGEVSWNSTTFATTRRFLASREMLSNLILSYLIQISLFCTLYGLLRQSPGDTQFQWLDVGLTEWMNATSRRSSRQRQSFSLTYRWYFVSF